MTEERAFLGHQDVALLRALIPSIREEVNPRPQYLTPTGPRETP
jgi:hypothetical protein